MKQASLRMTLKPLSDSRKPRHHQRRLSPFAPERSARRQHKTLERDL